VGRFPGTDGIKTGYINASGYNLVTSTKRGNKRLVGVVLGGRSANSRNAFMVSMLTKSFAKARDGRTIAAVAGSSKGIIDPLQQLKKKSATEEQTPDTATVVEKDTAALAAAANEAGMSTEEPEDAAETDTTGTPQVLEAQLNNDEDAAEETTTAPQPVQKLPFQVKKAATQADVDTLAVASIPSKWAVEIGDFKTRQSVSDARATLMRADAKRLADKDAKTIQVKRNGALVYRLLVSGYDEMTAKKSCAQIARTGKDCAVLSPRG
jgi:D-alanyl-D-alanine carboxypeptidase